MMIYMQLFWSMFQIGLFSIGGGYVAIPLIQRQIVELNGWLSAAEFADIIAIAEMTPGPIAINAATFVGARVAGIAGSLTATLACVLPSCVIVMLLARVYLRYRSLNAMRDVLSGLRPAVVGMIASAGFGMLLLTCFWDGVPSLSARNFDLASACVFIVGLIMLRKRQLHPMYIMGGAGVIGLLAYMLAGS